MMRFQHIPSKFKIDEMSDESRAIFEDQQGGNKPKTIGGYMPYLIEKGFLVPEKYRDN